MSEMHDGRENMQYLSDAMTDAERNRLAALAREALAHRETLNEVHEIRAQE